MKIGIITHHYINNFGAFLQGYALQKALGEEFSEAEVYIIDYLNVKHFIVNTLGWFRFYKDKENFATWKTKIKLPETFRKERIRHMHMTKRCYTAEQINRMNFDCIVVGSDEVWNYADKKSLAKVKFALGLTCENIIAYAPSVGKTDVDNNVPDYVVQGINKFSSFSTRDELTEKLIKKLTGKQPTKVLDPTFLYDIPKVQNKFSEKPYILFYYCDKLPEEYFTTIKKYAKENGFAIYGAGECNKAYDDITVNLTPFEWVQMFRDAHFVFTGTFHGTVFSILHSKQFACYLTNAGRVKKVGSLLNDFQIKNRDITNHFNIADLVADTIDYTSAYKIIDQKRQESIEFLKKAIRK